MVSAPRRRRRPLSREHPGNHSAIVCNRGYIHDRRAREMTERSSTGREETARGGPIGLRQFARYFLGLGIWGFGGPIATVGYMQRDLVEKRSWLGRDEFLNGVALGQTMPGPLAAQVVMWIGYLQAGALGALATALPFILPSFALVISVAVVYVQFKGTTVIQALFYGIAPAVMAVLATAAVKLANLTDGKDARLWVISAITLVVTAVTG